MLFTRDVQQKMGFSDPFSLMYGMSVPDSSFQILEKLKNLRPNINLFNNYLMLAIS